MRLKLILRKMQSKDLIIVKSEAYETEVENDMANPT